jgi:hypothetical protein
LPDLSRPVRLLWQHGAAGLQACYFRLDLWHGLHYSLPAFSGARRMISTFHDLAFFLYPQLYPPSKRLYFQLAIRRSLQAADAVIAVSQSTADDIGHLFPAQRLGEVKLRMVHSGVE